MDGLPTLFVVESESLFELLLDDFGVVLVEEMSGHATKRIQTQFARLCQKQQQQQLRDKMKHTRTEGKYSIFGKTSNYSLSSVTELNFISTNKTLHTNGGRGVCGIFVKNFINLNKKY